MKLAVAVDPGNDGSVRITISCHNKDHFVRSNFLAIRSYNMIPSDCRFTGKLPMEKPSEIIRRKLTAYWKMPSNRRKVTLSGKKTTVERTA